MVKVTWKGWIEEPTEKLPKAYEFLTGRNLKPFYKAFSTPQNARPLEIPESHEQNTEQTK